MNSEHQGPKPGETIHREVKKALRECISGKPLFSLSDSEKLKLIKSANRHKQFTNRIFRVAQCGSKAKLLDARDKYLASYHIFGTWEETQNLAEMTAVRFGSQVIDQTKRPWSAVRETDQRP